MADTVCQRNQHFLANYANVPQNMVFAIRLVITMNMLCDTSKEYEGVIGVYL